MEQEHRGYQMPYAPIPKDFIKEEPKEPNYEENRDEQVHNVITYRPLPHGAIKVESHMECEHPESNSGVQMESNEQDATSAGQETTEPQENQAAYYSLSSTEGIVKEEMAVLSDEDDDECQLVAYPSLPHGIIKEESEFGVGHDQINPGVEQQQLTEQGAIEQRNQTGSSTRPFDDESPVADNMGSTKTQRAIKRKRTTKSSPVALKATTSEEAIPSSRILRSRLKGNSTRKAPRANAGSMREKRMETEELEKTNNSGGKKQQQNSEHDDVGIEPSDDDSIEPPRATKRKRATKSIALKGDDTPITGSEEAMPSTRILRSRSKGKSIRKAAGKSGKRIETEDLEERNSRGEEQQKNFEYDDEDVESTDDDLAVRSRSKAGPSQRKKKATLKPQVENIYSDEETAEKSPALECGKCRRNFKRKGTLNRHLREVCGVHERQFTCKECGGQFKLEVILQKHLTNVHKIARSQLAEYGIVPKVRPTLPFKCGKCERTYKEKSSLTVHLKFECGVKPGFTCTICDCSITHKSSLRQHLVVVHGVDPSQLDNYGDAAKEVRPVSPFKCEKCGRTYTSKQHLRQHLSYECGLEPTFICTKCDEFKSKFKSNLIKHLRNVHGEGPTHRK